MVTDLQNIHGGKQTPVSICRYTQQQEMAQLVKGPYVCMADASSDLQHLCKKLCIQRHMPI